MKAIGARAALCAVVCLIALGGCASVDVQALNPDGTPSRQADGIRYYIPRPYIVAVALPPAPASGADANGGGGNNNGAQNPVPPAANQNGHPGGIAPNPPNAAPAGGAPATPQPQAADNTQTNKNATADTGNGQTTATAAGAAADGDFLFSNAGYMFKLIYLPDYSKPMAIQLRPGVFGTSSVSPQLAYGWMLTSMSASADNSKFIDDITSMVSSLAGGAAKAAKAGGAPSPGGQAPASQGLLAPGLYKVLLHRRTGDIAGLCQVAAFPLPNPIPIDNCADPD